MKKIYSLKHFFLMCMLCMIGSVSALAQGTVETFTYKKVTKTTDLVAGATYIIKTDSYKSYGQNHVQAMGCQKTDHRIGIEIRDYTEVNGSINIPKSKIATKQPTSGVDDLIYEFTLIQKENKWTIHDVVNDGNLAAYTTSSRGLNILTATSKDMTDLVSIDVNNAIFTFDNAGKNKYLRFNEGTEKFEPRDKTTSCKPIYLYKKVSTGPAAPTFTVTNGSVGNDGSFLDPITVKLATTESKGKIQYTYGADSDPKADGAKVSETNEIILPEISTTTTIKAVTFVEGTDGTKTFGEVKTITYTKKERQEVEPSTKDFTYELVKNASGLVNCGVYIIGNEYKGVTLVSQQNNDKRAATSTRYTAKNGKLELSSDIIATNKVSSQAFEFALDIDKQGSMKLKDILNDAYLSSNNKDNNLILSSSDAVAQPLFSNVDISCATTGDASIKFVGTQQTIYSLNGTSGFTTNSTRSKGYHDIQLYRKVDSFTISSVGYATYYTDQAFVMPQGVDGGVVLKDAEGNLKIKYCYAAGKVVPAKTALVLKGGTKGTAKTYTYSVAPATAGERAEGNLLHGTVDQIGNTYAVGATRYYKFANGEYGLGFYYGAEDGAAFKNGANKAYLAVDAETAVNMKSFSLEGMEEELTGIEKVENQTSKVLTIYDLNGRRIQASSVKDLSKGLYIVNGKKMIIK